MEAKIYRAGVDFNAIGLVAAAKRAIGVPELVIRLRPYERAHTLRVEDDKVTLVLQTFLVRELRTRTQFIKSGNRMVSYWRSTADGHYAGQKVGEMIIWDEEAPEVSAVVNAGQINTPERDTERREFERMTYRPGTSKSPLDNYQRVLAGPTTEKMERYW